MLRTRRQHDHDPYDATPEDGAEATPLIELTVDREPGDGIERSAGDPQPSGDRVGTRNSRPVPRRYLTVGAIVLLAVGFVAGFLVQRAGTANHRPAPAASSTHVAIPASGFDLSITYYKSGCRNFLRGKHEAGVTMVCTGVLHSIQHASDDWLLIIIAADGTRIAVAAHGDTTVLPAGSVGNRGRGELKVGRTLRVSGRMMDDHTVHSVAIKCT